MNTLIVPASRDVLDEMEKRGWCKIIRDAGATVLNPGCGPCFGAHEGLTSERDVVVSTTNRNFPGRMGSMKAEHLPGLSRHRRGHCPGGGAKSPFRRWRTDMNTIKGRVIVLGDDVDTDQILPGYAMAEPMDQLGNFAMAGLAGLDFKSVFQPGDIIVAGRNFGCGSSREQAPIALKQVGVALVIAKGFARIFRRNSINIGMPVWVADVADELKTGDVIEADLEKGTVTVNGEVKQFNPLSENVRKTLEYGGLIPRVRAELGIEG